MNGVEILSAQEAVAATVFNWSVFWISIGVFLVGMIALAIYVIYDNGHGMDWSILIFCIVVGLVMGCLVGFLFGTLWDEPVEYETHYKVTIDDTVSMNEFLEQYEIIDQEGKIYTVRERQ